MVPRVRLFNLANPDNRQQMDLPQLQTKRSQNIHLPPRPKRLTERIFYDFTYLP